MSKADKLRAALRASNNRMTRADAIKIIGTPGNLSNMTRTGEVSIERDDDITWIVLDPDFKTKRALPIKRKKTKRAKAPAKHKRARRAIRSYKALADKVAQASLATADLRTAILDNLVASAEHLAATLRREVEGVDTNPALIAAIEQSERAAALARAA